MKKILILFTALITYANLEAQDFISYRRTFNEILKTAKDVSAFETFIDTTQAYYYDFSVKLSKLNKKSENKNKEFCMDYWENCKKKIKVDTALLFKVTDMAFRDQAAREDGIDDKEMAVIDSLNHIKLKKIIIELGKIPGINELDSYGMLEVGLLLRHLNGDTVYFNFLHPYMLKAAKNGDFVPDQIAAHIDYYWFGLFTPKDSTKGFSYQRYGTMEFRLDKTTKIKIPIKDWEETERLRYEIGMPSLQQELEENPNVIYDLELFKEKFPSFQE